jgi:hypothetical protein
VIDFEGRRLPSRKVGDCCWWRGYRDFADGIGNSFVVETDEGANYSTTSEWSSEAGNIGLKRGDWVSVTPDDYGNPVFGSILAWTTDEIVLRHEDPSCGKVNLRFPRVGFDVSPAEKQAA